MIDCYCLLCVVSDVRLWVGLGVFWVGVVVICWFVLGFCFGVRSRGWWLFMDVCKLLVLVDYRLCGFCFWVCCVGIDCILLFVACVAGSLCFNCVFC